MIPLKMVSVSGSGIHKRQKFEELLLLHAGLRSNAIIYILEDILY